MSIDAAIEKFREDGARNCRGAKGSRGADFALGLSVEAPGSRGRSSVTPEQRWIVARREERSRARALDADAAHSGDGRSSD